MKLGKDLVAASATPLLLSILTRGESYGYTLLQQIREMSDQEITWTDGMLYPLLHRLEQQKFIQSRWEPSESGRPRKYYRLTPKGRRALAAHQQQWRLVHRTLSKAWRPQYARV